MDLDFSSENDSDWDCENEVSDSGNSDTESDYSATDEDEVMEVIQMDGWTTVVNPFTDQLLKSVEKHHSEYDFNPAIDFEESVLLLVRFKDGKYVYLLTSTHSAGFCEKETYSVGGKQIYFGKSKHIEFYNQNMGSGDAVDQDTEPYSPLRKSYTWSTKVALHLLYQMLLNSKVISSNSHGKQISMFKYTKLCCHGILAKYSEGYRKRKDNVQGPAWFGRFSQGSWKEESSPQNLCHM
ncbi:hypothetical protein JTB14_034040 [Gonioctena quinquepunctata]|nr:hypothetical protein JTB14_034040 [Gonioctena quinquepunctata]